MRKLLILLTFFTALHGCSQGKSELVYETSQGAVDPAEDAKEMIQLLYLAYRIKADEARLVGCNPRGCQAPSDLSELQRQGQKIQEIVNAATTFQGAYESTNQAALTAEHHRLASLVRRELEAYQRILAANKAAIAGWNASPVVTKKKVEEAFAQAQAIALAAGCQKAEQFALPNCPGESDFWGIARLYYRNSWTRVIKAYKIAYLTRAAYHQGKDPKEYESSMRQATELENFQNRLESTRPLVASLAVRETREAMEETLFGQGLTVSFPPERNYEFQFTTPEDLVAYTEERMRKIAATGGLIAKLEREIAERAIDRINLHAPENKIYGNESFAFHPSHPNALTIDIRTEATEEEILNLLQNLPKKTGREWRERQALLQEWEALLAASAEWPATAGIPVRVTLAVSDVYKKESVRFESLESTVAWLRALGAARGFINTYIAKSGRKVNLTGDEEIVICAERTCFAYEPSPRRLILQAGEVVDPTSLELKLLQFLIRLEKEM